MKADTRKRLKHCCLLALACAGYLLLLPAWAAWRRRRRPEFRVLTYHSVSDGRQHATNVKPAAFEQQMAFLAGHAAVHDLLALLRGPPQDTSLTHLPRVAITFDDGYADNARVALPILRRHGFTATCFVVAGLAGGSGRLAHDRNESQGGARLLSWDEARELAAGGVRIGSHLLHHCRIGSLDDEALRDEMFGSKLFLERNLGFPVETVSYPYGRAADFDARAGSAARAAGYIAAATAMYGWNRAGDDPFLLRRIGVESSDTLFTLRAKVNGALDLMVLLERPALRRILRYLK